MKKLILLSAIVVLGAFQATAALAGERGRLKGNVETVDISGSFYLYPGQTKSVHVADHWRYVQKVYVQVTSYGQDAWLKVFANGDYKGTIHVPANDPSYVVTIAEAVQTIEIQNASTRGKVVINDVKAVIPIGEKPFVDDGDFFELDEIEYGAYPQIDSLIEDNLATSLARAGIALVRRLREDTDPATEYVRFLLPIHVAASRVLYLAGPKGVLNADVRPALIGLVGQIVAAKPLTDRLLLKESTWPLALRLLALKEKIKDELN